VRAGRDHGAWAQLSNIASRAKDVLGVDKLAIADRGYFNGSKSSRASGLASP
jgi:hypothetical protein